MKLELKNSLCIFDLETTGINITKDRIVEIAILKVMPNGEKENFYSLVNPGISIPPEVSKIHGITDEKVKDEPDFKSIAKDIIEFIGGSDLGGYNSNRFDVPLLVEEFLRNDFEFNILERKLIDVQVIFHKMEQRTLSAAYKFYCKKTLEDAHTATADTKATYEVLLAQLERYESLEGNIDFLSDYTSRGKWLDFAGRIVMEDGMEKFNFGKHKGKSVRAVMQVEPGYYNWIMNSDFPLYTKNVLQKIKESI